MSDDLPMGWELVGFPEVVFFQEGPGLRKYQYRKSGVPFLNIRTFVDERIDKKLCNYLDLEEVEQKYKHFLVDANDILVATSGSIGKMAIAKSQDLPLMLNTSIMRFRPITEERLERGFLYFFLKSNHFFTQAESAWTGTAQKNMGPSHVKTFNILLPPLNEQRRIVDKLDRIGDRHRTACNELSHIPKLIARYKQAVLAAACSGKLTEDWREENQISNNLKPVKLSEVATLKLGKMLDKAKNQGTLTPYLRNINVRWFAFDVTDIKEIRVSEDERKNLAIRKGDVMICEGGEPGRCAIWEGIDDFYVYQKTVYRLRPSEKILPEWVCYCLKNGADSGTLSELFTGTTIKHLTSVAFKEFQLLLPSLEEQKEIVRRVEKMFEKIDRMEQEYQKAAKLCDRLEQATLAKAFRGELVPQDPDDEPASVLLEQVKSQRSKGKKGK